MRVLLWYHVKIGLGESAGKETSVEETGLHAVFGLNLLETCIANKEKN